MNRKDQYKHAASSTESQRVKRRQEGAQLRKEKREKVLSSKRVRLSEGDDSGDIADFSVEQVKEFARSIRKSDEKTPEHLRNLRKAFAQGSLLISAFLEVEQSLRAMIGYLTGRNSQLQLEAAWCITNMAAGSHEDTMTVTKAAAPYLITFLGGSNVLLQDQSAWALGNMSGDSLECREILMAQGIIPPLINLLKSSSPSVVQSAAFALSNLARGPSTNVNEMMNLGIAPLCIAHLVPRTPVDVMAEVAWTLTYLTAKREFVPEFVRLGIIEKYVQLLNSFAKDVPHNSQLVTPLLRSLGNIVSGPDEYGALAIKDGILLSAMLLYMQSTHRHIRKEMLWVLSNLTAGPTDHAIAVANAGVIPIMLEMMSSTFDIKKEAALGLCNLAFHGPSFVKQILQNNAVIDAFINILKSPDQELVITGLQFFEMAFRHCPDSKDSFEHSGGVSCLEALEYNCNQTIQQQANELLDSHFMEEEISEEGTCDDGFVEYPSWREQENNMTS